MKSLAHVTLHHASSNRKILAFYRCSW